MDVAVDCCTSPDLGLVGELGLSYNWGRNRDLVGTGRSGLVLIEIYADGDILLWWSG
jgi:hypothetical protein